MAKYSIEVEFDFEDEDLDDAELVDERAKLKSYLEDEYLAVFSTLDYEGSCTANITAITVVDQED